jgi:hypothetical protein
MNTEHGIPYYREFNGAKEVVNHPPNDKSTYILLSQSKTWKGVPRATFTFDKDPTEEKLEHVVGTFLKSNHAFSYQLDELLQDDQYDKLEPKFIKLGVDGIVKKHLDAWKKAKYEWECEFALEYPITSIIDKVIEELEPRKVYEFFSTDWNVADCYMMTLHWLSQCPDIYTKIDD